MAKTFVSKTSYDEMVLDLIKLEGLSKEEARNQIDSMIKELDPNATIGVIDTLTAKKSLGEKK